MPTEPSQGPVPIEGFDRWAWILLLVLGALAVLVGGMAIDRGPAEDGPSGSAGLAAMVSLFVGAAMLFGVAWGLGARRSWARPAAVLLLWVLIAIGILRIAFALAGAGTLTLPVEAILAALVLATLPREERRTIGHGQDRSVAQLFAGIYAMSALLPLALM